MRDCWAIARRDAPGHRSPNAGWPEAAFAAALGLRFGGPRAYGGESVEGVRLNREGADDVASDDVAAGLALFSRLCLLLLGLALLGAVIALVVG